MLLENGLGIAAFLLGGALGRVLKRGGKTTQLPSEALLLRIFLSECDKIGTKPLFQAIVEEARQRGMAGATVLRGFLGFGATSRIHTSRVLQLSEDLPLVVEIVDTEERIEAFLPYLDEVVREGLVTLERVLVIAYRHKKPT